jgi:pimeloyl-[acyl-carrier protein] synthase
MSEPILAGAARLPRFDPTDPGFRNDRYRVFDEYRRHDPVHWNGDPSKRQVGHWFIFDHASAVIALKDRRFCRQYVRAPRSGPASKPPAACPFARSADRPEQAPASPSEPGAFAEVLSNCMLFLDPPRQTRLRSALSPSFAPPATRALKPFIERRARELLEPLTKAASFDFMKEFALPFPLDVIGEMLGVQASDRPKFRLWSSALRDGIDRPKWGSDAFDRAEVATLALREYFEAAWTEHSRKPNESVLGELFRLERLDAGLSKDEAFGTFVLLMVAGHETTTHLLGNGMHLFAQFPGERDRLLEQPDLIHNAIEEILRFESPVQMAPRFVAGEVELGGHRLMPGQHVEIVLGSANRDPSVFEEPERFNVARTPNPHVAFGHGERRCLGAPVARMVASIALPILLKSVRAQAFPSGTGPWSTSTGFRGLTHLPAVPC